ncbi:hypothetical protein MYCTH_100011 [Thermothelomyces thermophilus ATCC 42464]|uniref:Alpha-ketoglutarate-dependent dioxygenase AlkB-like domain-containing protein n=1 Tax=Thermothelomyces thermophilus (strain ATCC 42464 / BCRC 31852 / DSM 1799) TaxID=573729 RepID=G2Q701_THET4|nr:uncharacterized protein MYCTH_100011 [Thermothelomyces thermophilus ATCC 42464]AEO54781.1 hypothetical protein MYCTH_100011 [Thermothelomyces thermophilus ATCC 42464]
MSNITNKVISQTLSPVDVPPKTFTSSDTTKSRLAAQRLRIATKRAAADLEDSTSANPEKRIRLDASEGGESSESNLAQRTTDRNDGDKPNDSSKPIIGSRTDASEEASFTQHQVIQPISNRSPAAGRPLVWANGRGSLCEALPYFRAFKGSLHSADLVCQGFLIDQEADQRDVFGSQVIISSVGGGRTKDPGTGSMIRSKDASDTASNIKAIMNAYHNKSLVAEKQIPIGGSKDVTVWRMRFEKADLTEPSWWVPKGEDATMPAASLNTDVKAPVAICKQCNTPSKEIFTAGWFCLNHKCENYFVLPTGMAVDAASLAYSDTFLNERSPFMGAIPSVKPAVHDFEGFHGTELALRRGFVCPDCGCCNRRVYWNRWVCENKECQYARDALMLPYPEALLRKENKEFDGRMQRRSIRYGVNENTLHQEDYLHDPFATIYQRGYLQFSQTLTLGGIFSASKEITSKPNGPDDLFRTLELTDIGLRRNPAAVVGHKLEGYTRHFQQNFGARYKFGVTVQSKGFSEAPDIILRALQRLIWAKQVAVEHSNAFIKALDPKHVGKHAVVSNSGDFNELLALGYMEQDKINYHDDGERELGPVVAALSLGSPSTMRFRPKRNTQFFLPTQQVQGKTCYKEVLEVTMKHGDMMVMIGTEIQKVYEHTVEPYGKRRFSLTARYIDPEKMESQEDRDDAAVKGAIPKHAQAFSYDGF